MTQAHAFLPPSGADNWAACAAWPTMQQTHPDLGDPTASEEGTRAHALLAEVMSGAGVNPYLSVGEEMADAVMLAADYARSLPVAEWHVERHLSGEAIAPAGKNHGTPDLLGWHGLNLYVLDFKYGHRHVPHIGNLQLVNYAALALDNAVNIDGLVEQSVTVHLTIIQPRAYGHDPVRTWKIPAGELRAYANVLRNAAERALRPGAPASTGPQCTYCNGRHACAALRQVAGAAIDLSNGGSSSIALTTAAIGAELSLVDSAIARLDAVRSGLQEQARHALLSGGQIPGWQMQSKSGREAWRLPADQVLALGVPAGPAKPVTPTQARKAGVAPEIVSMLAARPTTAPELVRADPEAKGIF